MKRVFLKVPSIDELHYRQEWMKDKKTMSYNAGFELELNSYDNATGTIAKQMKKW